MGVARAPIDRGLKAEHRARREIERRLMPQGNRGNSAGRSSLRDGAEWFARL